MPVTLQHRSEPEHRHHVRDAPRTMLCILSILLNHDPRVPLSLDDSRTMGSLATIHAEQSESSWQQLRSRYPTHALAAREFHAATVRATGLVDSLIPARTSEQSQRYALGRLALVAAITRDLVVDGIKQVERRLRACHQRLKELGLAQNATPGHSNT